MHVSSDGKIGRFNLEPAVFQKMRPQFQSNAVPQPKRRLGNIINFEARTQAGHVLRGI